VVQPKRERAGAAAPYSVVISADADPEGWLRERQKLLTATDIPSILGVPGARSALETWYQKKDALVARAESDAIRQAKAAGHDFEDFNALMFAKAAGRPVERSQQLIRSTRYPWLGATLDYLQQNGTKEIRGAGAERAMHMSWLPLELKNAGSHAADDMWPLGGEPHLIWQMQVTVQMIVMAVSIGSLSAWLGSPFVHHRWCDLELDLPLAAIILDEGGAFQKSLKRKTPPKDPNPALAYEVLRRLSPSRAKHKVVSLPPAAVSLDARIRHLEIKQDQARGSLKVVTDMLDIEKGALAQLIGEHDSGKLKDGTVWTFKHVHVPAHQVAAHSYRKLNRVSAQSSKPRKVTWKTSR
jgi:hypothetical protein